MSESDTPADKTLQDLPTAPHQDVEEMSVEELREEYTTYDIASLSVEHPYWDRHVEVWAELESRDVVDVPDCHECGEDRWRFGPGGPPHCAACGAHPESGEQEMEIHEASQRLLNGGDE